MTLIMTDKKGDFDKFVDALQQEIYEQELKDFNEYIVHLFHSPKNWGKPEDFTVSYSLKGPCNDTMEFFLTLDGETIINANFITDGCGPTVAAASQTTLFITGKEIGFAETLTPESIDKALHGLPEDHKHCAVLAINTLKGVIKKYKAQKNKAL